MLQFPFLPLRCVTQRLVSSSVLRDQSMPFKEAGCFFFNIRSYQCELLNSGAQREQIDPLTYFSNRGAILILKEFVYSRLNVASFKLRFSMAAALTSLEYIFMLVLKIDKLLIKARETIEMGTFVIKQCSVQ